MAALIIIQCFLNFKRAECVLQSVEPRFINQVKSESSIASLQGSSGSSVKSSDSKKQIENLFFNRLHHFTIEKTVQGWVCNLPKVIQQVNSGAGTRFHIPQGTIQNSCAVSTEMILSREAEKGHIPWDRGTLLNGAKVTLELRQEMVPAWVLSPRHK